MAIQRLEAGENSLPVIQLVSGLGVSLADLARDIIESAGSSSTLMHQPSPRAGDTGFVGDPTRAFNELGWLPGISLQSGIQQLIHDLRRCLADVPVEGKVI